MAFVERIVHEWGVWSYLATFLYAFIMGEYFVPVIGFMVAQGALSAAPVLVACWLGSFCGDQCWFWVGRHFGLRVLARRPHWREHVDRTLAWIKRYNALFILGFRFIYGVRYVSAFAVGITGIGWRKFLILNFIGALIWAIGFLGAGYLFGQAFANWELPRHARLFFVTGIIVVAAVGYLIYRYRRRPRRPINVPSPQPQRLL